MALILQIFVRVVDIIVDAIGLLVNMKNRLPQSANDVSGDWENR